MRLPSFEDNPELKRRAYCLLGSFMIHAVFFTLLFLLFRPIKVIVYEKKITDLLITPREKLFLPDLEGGLPETGSLDQGLEERLLGKRPRLSRTAGEPATLSEGAAESVPESQEEGTPESAYSSGFRLGVPSDTPQNPPIAGELSLAFSPGKTTGIPDALQEGPRKRNVDLKRYAHPGSPGTGLGTSGYFSGGPRRRTALSRTSVTFDDRGIDLSPWASELVDRTQKNWLVDPSDRIPERTEVKIFVKARKTGDILAVEIITPSQAVSFDRTAINAIHLSSPFSKLPDDFPGEDIDIIFIFSTR